MQALVKTGLGAGHLEIKDWPEPSTGPDEVKLKIAAAGICGTDIHIVKGEWPCRPPVVLGHEFCGTVVEAGKAVKQLNPGDRVVASNPARTCGHCYHCRAGNPFMCAERVSAGYMIDGAFAEFLCIREERCHRLPDTVSFRQAALGEPLAVAVHAVIERSTIYPGDVALISGPGCVGLLTMLVAKLTGARVIVAGIGKDERRLALARELGADFVVDASQEDISEIVQKVSGGAGADVVYECAGASASLDLCWKAARREGTLAQVGIYPGPIETDLNNVVMKELRLIGSFGYVWTSWRRALRLLSESKINADILISHRLPLQRFDEAFQITQDGTATKVIFDLEAQ